MRRTLLLLYETRPRSPLPLLARLARRCGSGQELTLDHARGGGILITIEAPEKVPSRTITSRSHRLSDEREGASDRGEKPMRIRAEPIQLDRFAIDATFGTEKVRLEYAVLKQTDGGLTVAARLPRGTPMCAPKSPASCAAFR